MKDKCVFIDCSGKAKDREQARIVNDQQARRKAAEVSKQDKIRQKLRKQGQTSFADLGVKPLSHFK